MGVVAQRHAPVPIGQEAGWDPGPERTGAKISPPHGFDPPTVQPVGSRYTDCAIPVFLGKFYFKKKVLRIFMETFPLCLLAKKTHLV